MTLRTGIPAPPSKFVDKNGNVTPDAMSFLRAVKQDLDRLEGIVSAQANLIATCMKYSIGQIYQILNQSGGVTPNPKNGHIQYLINNAAFTLNAPLENCQMTLLIQNGPSAGTLTDSGFTKVTGSSFDTTTQHMFAARITVFRGKSWLEVQALQ